MLQLEQDQLYAQTQDQLNICMRITEIVQPGTESIGPAPRGVCVPDRPPHCQHRGCHPASHRAKRKEPELANRR